MKLSTVVSAVAGARMLGGAETEITDLAYDSRAVSRGALFFCVPGAHVDGHAFARAALASGSVALVVEREIDLPAPQVIVPSSRAAMGPAAAAFFGHPSRAITLVGVTGTNGKTTTTFMLEPVFRALEMGSGVVGTIETRIGEQVVPVTRTTPESIDLQRVLARMRDDGVRGASMEVSSEGIHQGRVEGTEFACSIFTNLGQDHLNYHGTMEAYFEAKALLFRPSMSARAAINVGDAFGRRLAERTRLPIVTFSLEGEADVRAVSIVMDRSGSDVACDVRGERVNLRVALPARYNVENALAVLATAVSLGWPVRDVARGIGALRGVPGRLEPVDAGQDFTVLVDYAHTPDSLEGVLRAARELTPSGARLVAVFGCGGDRDRGKRPLMGRVAATLADRAIITSDNPRTEDPLAIVAEIEAGARASGAGFESIPDRRDAIEAALRGARAGDVVVIAGKGHETGQQFAERTVPFDDRLVAREILESM